jgi:hypothetical protein
VVAHSNPLVEGFHDGKLHDALQIGLTGKDEDKGVVGIHFEVGEESEFFEGTCLKKMSLIDDQKDGLPRILFGLQKGPLDLTIDGALGEPGREAEEAIDVIQQIGATEGGKGGIVGFKKIFIEGIDVASEGEGLSHAGISGQKQDTAPALDIIKPSHGFLEGFGLEDILSLEILIKRKPFEPKPSKQVFHGTTSPL